MQMKDEYMNKVSNEALKMAQMPKAEMNTGIMGSTQSCKSLLLEHAVADSPMIGFKQGKPCHYGLHLSDL